MRALVAGGGPVGIVTGMALARRGFDVTLVDRDPGPAPDGTWQRAGVMQFQHPHGYRPGVARLLLDELPDVYEALVAAGAEPHAVPVPDSAPAMFCRRSVVERTLRAAAMTEPRLRWVTGHVEAVQVADGVAGGLVVDGATLAAEIVVVTTGRAGHLGAELRGPIDGGPCGFSYVSRMYRARDGQPACDLPLPSFITGPGYISLVMPQDARTHSLLVCYPSSATEFAALRTNDGFAAAAGAIPNLAPWCDPNQFEPITDALVGGNLTNTYCAQGPAIGLPPARGLFFLGDAVSTTNPAAGRNLSLSFGLVGRFLATLDEPHWDPVEVSLALDLWAEAHIRPWFLDHVRWDRTLLRRFSGQDLDLTEPIPSDVICAAAEVDPSLWAFAGPYLGMAAGPSVLDPAQDRVRALLETGWRPAFAGPPVAELVGGVVDAVHR